MTPKENAQNEEYRTPPPSPGKRLKRIRESKGLTLARAAAQLHLQERILEALENDDFDRLPGAVFIKGYYRNYARLLGVAEESILSDLEAACPNAECQNRLKSVSRHMRTEVHSGHGFVKLISWSVGLAMVVAFAVWMKGYLDTRVIEVISPDSSVPEPTGEVAMSSGPSELMLPRFLAPEEPAEEPAAAAAEVSEEAATEASSAAAQTEAAAAAEAEAVAAEVAELPAPQPAATEPAPSPVGIVLEFSGKSWVDIRDAGGFKLVGEMREGDRRVLGGRPPYKVVLGNFRVVTMSIDGIPYDLTPHADGNVARFTLSPVTPVAGN